MNRLIAEEVANDVLFITEHNENVWWYDGERIAFRTPSYNRILRAMLIEDQATQAYLQKEAGINRSALQKMLVSLQGKGYIHRDDNGRWRVFLTPSM